MPSDVETGPSCPPERPIPRPMPDAPANSALAESNRTLASQPATERAPRTATVTVIAWPATTCAGAWISREGTVTTGRVEACAGTAIHAVTKEAATMPPNLRQPRGCEHCDIDCHPSGVHREQNTGPLPPRAIAPAFRTLSC